MERLLESFHGNKHLQNRQQCLHLNKYLELVQNFEKYTHFGDKTDFTAAVQTFREGMTFAEGSVFNNEQVFPVNTVLSHGIVINEVECSDSACVPDPADVIAPGEKYRGRY